MTVTARSVLIKLTHLQPLQPTKSLTPRQPHAILYNLKLQPQTELQEPLQTIGALSHNKRLVEPWNWRRNRLRKHDHCTVLGHRKQQTDWAVSKVQLEEAEVITMQL
jgi:hypothetical protein